MNDSTSEAEELSSEQIEEGYWLALLNEGEFAKTVNIDQVSPYDPHSKPDKKTPPSSSLIEISEAKSEGWDEIVKIQTNDETVSLDIIGCNRGGLLVEWKSLRGFVPASQLIQGTEFEDKHARQDHLASYIGKHLSLRVIELDVEKNRLIFSERAAQVESGKRSKILHKLTADSIVKGYVTNLCDFGAFVDLGGIEGLIHISELSWGRVAHPSDMLTSGDYIEVYILDVNEKEERIALSLKRLHNDPWETVQQRYHVGEIVEGRITNVVDFGAFARIEDGLEGLIHFSELAEGQFLHPRNVVSENDIVTTRILSINSKTRRLGLSLRYK